MGSEHRAHERDGENSAGLVCCSMLIVEQAAMGMRAVREERIPDLWLLRGAPNSSSNTANESEKTRRREDPTIRIDYQGWSEKGVEGLYSAATWHGRW